jgi:hypothetical protein
LIERLPIQYLAPPPQLGTPQNQTPGNVAILAANGFNTFRQEYLGSLASQLNFSPSGDGLFLAGPQSFPDDIDHFSELAHASRGGVMHTP